MTETPTTQLPHDLQGSTALVTGATSGIGRAAAVHLARRGATVLIGGRSSERGAEVVARITEAGSNARFIAADVATAEGARALADEAGEVDILVNNAGTSWFGPTDELDDETYDRMFAANVRSTYLLTASIAPKLAARGTGSIINVGSMAGTLGLVGAAAYGATKAAVESMTRAWAAEYGPRGVRINAVSPGPVFTAIAPRERTQALGEASPLGRAAEADEIAQAIGFLASPAASYINGATIAVDAGRTVV